MELLSSTEVIECSASDLVGQYVGQTGPKTRKLFERALGKVLFVDEAYRLSQGHFAQEAVDEIVGLITQPKFKGKLIVVLAGYEKDMNHLMSVNSGLSSRFPERVTFDNMDPGDCLSIVRKELAKKNIAIKNPSPSLYDDMADLISQMSELPDWGNARDMMTFSKMLIGTALLNATPDASPMIHLDEKLALKALREMLDERVKRSRIPPPSRKFKMQAPVPVQTATQEPPPPPVVSTSQATAEPAPKAPPPAEPSRPATPASTTSTQSREGSSGRGARGRGAARGRGRGRGGAVPAQPAPIASVTPVQGNVDPERDAGVTDAVWDELRKAKQAAIDQERDAVRQINSLAQRKASQAKNEKAAKDELARIQKEEAEAHDSARRTELQRQREQARLKEHAARVARERAERELAAKRAAEKQRKEQEEKAQRKLREMGVCVAGFRWIKSSGGYRCAGGSHWVSDAQLGI